MEPYKVANYFDTMSQAQKYYGKYLEPICKQWGLTRNEMDVILFLFNNPEFDRAADIVSRRGIAKSHVSLSVSNLESRGLLIRCAEPADRRAVHLKLTEQACGIARQGREAQHSFFARIYEGISPEEMNQWRSLTEKIVKNIEKLEKL